MTEQDVAALRDELAAGTTVTVWFTAAAVGVPTGGSAKIVAVGEVPEGDFIQVRPAGSRDTMFCSPNELTRARPARRPAAPRSRLKPAEKEKPAETQKPAAEEQAPAPEPPAPQGEPPAAPVKKSPARPRKRAERSGPVTVSLSSTVDGDWAVEVRVGAKRVVAATPLPATVVAAVSRSLPPAVAEVMTSALAEARRRQEERVAQLREELDAAQRTLEQLGVDSCSDAHSSGCPSPTR
ncbi:DUF6319 family protein [Pseudonocardia sulfidoxydans]|uniref:DUF6319 family protein n=1 Tax=Pseudonocardia sulfidoxydans TaxID=54011 RepID=UPI0011BDE826|nr:DUF6319 family protein [Pseudonocardia sulfidoxydans]